MPFRTLATVRRPARLLVVGGASLDVLHVRGVPTPSPGGAGLYTALAAARLGVEVTMLAPLPSPMPEVLVPALDRIRWIGPTVRPEELPRFEIAYDAAGDVTLFRQFLGAEVGMRPELLDLLDDEPGGVPPIAYCVPFLDAELQRAFTDALLARGCLVAANTYLHGVREQTDAVRGTFGEANVFFCNEVEAAVLLGETALGTTSPRLLFVTRGARGATVCQGDAMTEVPSPAVEALDPTGAGDTFCGTVLASLALGVHPIEAASAGCFAAADEVMGVGPERLWRPMEVVDRSATSTVSIDEARVTRMARLIAELPDATGFDFVGDGLPPVGGPDALAWFFASTLQQFGFWYETADGYSSPVIASLDGRARKGSDYLWAALQRWAERDPAAFLPQRQAALTHEVLVAALRDDDGNQPLPTIDLALRLANAYGRSMVQAGWTPATIVEAANASERPTAALLALLDHVGGYREDPLRKKAALLAVALRQRPERWLRIVDGDEVPPIVDYHVQRTCLRTGMVRVDDGSLRDRLLGRRHVDAVEEAAVRRAAFAVVQALVDRSGCSMGAVDWFLFQMRSRCPEMSTPDCAVCPAASACAKDVALFQPVFRTDAY